MFDIPLYYFSLSGWNFGVQQSSVGSLFGWLGYLSSVNVSSAEAGALVQKALFLWTVVGVLFLVERTLCAVTIYKSARQRTPRLAAMWTVFTAFFGVIPLTVFAIQSRVASAQRVVCVECGHTSVQEQPRVRLNRLWLTLSLVAFAAFSVFYNYAFTFSTGMG